MKSELLTAMGDRLRRRRKQMNLTQEQAAELLEISTTFYGEVERGNRRLSLEKIVKVHERMGLEPDFMILGKVSVENRVTEMLRECSEEKAAVVEEIVRNVVLLIRD